MLVAVQPKNEFCWQDYTQLPTFIASAVKQLWDGNTWVNFLISFFFHFHSNSSRDFQSIFWYCCVGFSRGRSKTMMKCKFIAMLKIWHSFKMSGLIFSYFFFAFIGTCLWEQPKVQRREIHHWNGTHDKRQWLGIEKKRTDPQWTKNFYMSSEPALDFVQRLCFIHNVKRAFILEKNHTDILIYERTNLELFRKKSSPVSL